MCFEKIVIFALQRFSEARRKAPTEGIKWESGANPEQFPLLYVPASLFGGANVCDTLLPLTSGSGRRRRRNESEDLPLRLNFVLPFLASAIRVNSIALGLTKWLNFSSISRLGNSSKLDCARLDEMVGNLRLRVTGESRKRLLGSNRIEREASPANVRGGTKRLSTIRYSGSEFRGRIFRFGISGPRGERTETYLPTRLSGERRRD